MIKAISLLSGGLDSILATKLILEHGIEVEAVNFVTVFCNCTSKGKTCLASKSAADNLGVKLKVFEVSSDYLDIVKNPRHGYGRNLNPCLDCRIFIFKKAAQYMKETGAYFLITGEVLGERPMSQRKQAIDIIERDANLKGLILRPLSAKLFKPTIAEEKGWVDRERLLSISGRCRKPQIELAKEFDIKDYPCPAGGCLLTDSGFANRMRDLMKYSADFNVDDVRFLKVGRHFRISEKAKLIVGRNEEENTKLMNLAAKEGICFYPAGVAGPTAIGRGAFNDELLARASSVVARYSDVEAKDKLEIIYRNLPDGSEHICSVLPMADTELDKLRI